MVCLIHCLGVLLCVPYIIACKCRLLCGVLLIIIIGNYNYLCSVPRAVCYIIATRSIFVLCRVSRFICSGSPPPQTKTLQTKRVLLYRVRFCSRRIGKVTENFCSVVSFVLLRRFELLYIYASCKELEDRRLAVELVK